MRRRSADAARSHPFCVDLLTGRVASADDGPADPVADVRAVVLRMQRAPDAASLMHALADPAVG